MHTKTRTPILAYSPIREYFGMWKSSLFHANLRRQFGGHDTTSYQTMIKSRTKYRFNGFRLNQCQRYSDSNPHRSSSSATISGWRIVATYAASRMSLAANAVRWRVVRFSLEPWGVLPTKKRVVRVRFGVLYRVYDTTCSGPVASYYNPFGTMSEITNA